MVIAYTTNAPMNTSIGVTISPTIAPSADPAIRKIIRKNIPAISPHIAATAAILRADGTISTESKLNNPSWTFEKFNCNPPSFGAMML